MVLQLAAALDVPLRERNSLLLAAGYAAVYRETDLDAPELQHVRGAVDFLLARAEPYPAVVIDAAWNLRQANLGAARLLPALLPRPPARLNLMRVLFDPRPRRWLLEKGIADHRITAVGYGERLILNQCVNGVKCTDDEHRFNRRTEFKILEGPTTIEIKKEVIKGQKAQKPNTPSRGESNGGLRSVRSFPDRAKISFDETFHDFGLIEEGQEVSHTYYFTNAGKSDLKIMRVSAGGQTKIKWPADVIKPGDKSSIESIFDTGNKAGEHEITIQVIANSDPVVVEARFRVFIKENK